MLKKYHLPPWIFFLRCVCLCVKKIKQLLPAEAWEKKHISGREGDNIQEVMKMKKSIRNTIIGAVMAIGVFGASTAALASTQYAQADMNFRSGASTSASVIGGVPAGAQVELLDSQNGWDLISYNGMTGYIHGGNLASTYTTPAPTTDATSAYYDNNWTSTASSMNYYNRGEWRTVYVDSGYLALREAPAFGAGSEIGQLYTGDMVQVEGECSGSYIYVYSPKYGTSGWVNAGFLG